MCGTIWCKTGNHWKKNCRFFLFFLAFQDSRSYIVTCLSWQTVVYSRLLTISYQKISVSFKKLKLCPIVDISNNLHIWIFGNFLSATPFSMETYSRNANISKLKIFKFARKVLFTKIKIKQWNHVIPSTRGFFNFFFAITQTWLIAIKRGTLWPVSRRFKSMETLVEPCVFFQRDVWKALLKGAEITRGDASDDK
jgi:hypothetical protein